MSRRWQTLQLRAWRMGDERRFEYRGDMAEDAAAVGWLWRERGMPGPTWALIRAGDGAVLGIGGGVESARGDWMLWSLLSDLGRRDWPAALACAREVMRRLERDWGGRHFTATARAESPGAHLVLQRLGFELYGPSLRWPGHLVFERAARRRRKAA